VEKEDYRELSRRIESILSPYENRVWWLYLSGLTANNIAARLQKSERSIQNAIYRIRKKLRASLTAP
jgi:RNA polymerase sporulation-specific sigma factor